MDKPICIMPFIHMGSKPDGVARVCCMAPELEIKYQNQLINFKETPLEDAWNSEYMKDLRNRFLMNEKVEECKACWEDEKNGKKSKRLRENKKYGKVAEMAIQQARANNGLVSSKPIYFDLRLGNLCNLKCRTCNPLFSSSWLNELKKSNLKGMSKKNIEFLSGQITRANKIGKWPNQNFFDQLNEIIPNIREVYISGGEPMLIEELKEFVDYCVQTENMKNIQLRLNSNIEKIDKDFFKNMCRFKKLTFGASIDAYGERNEWLRHPSKWSRIEKNLNWLANESKDLTSLNLSVNITVSAYNVLYIDELILWIKARWSKMNFTIDFVHHPDFMHLSLLPEGIRFRTIEKLENLISLLSGEEEILQIHQVIEALSDIETEFPSGLLSQFKDHTKTVDTWRGQNFTKIFPELASFFNSIN